MALTHAQFVAIKEAELAEDAKNKGKTPNKKGKKSGKKAKT